MGNGLIVNAVFWFLSMKISIAVDEQLLILVRKSAVVYKSYDAKRESICNLLLVLTR